MKNSPVKLLLTLNFLIYMTSIAQANGLDRFFQSLGGQVNHSTPGSYHDQAAGYYTGGGYVLRQNNTVVQPINISLPKLGAGCNSLDMYFGSLSFLQTEKLVQLGRQVITGIPVYGLKLALKSLTPQIADLMAELNAYVQKMNGLMLNSCQATQAIVGGLWPKGTAASEQICMDNKRSGNMDFFGSREHCNQPNTVNDQVEQSKTKYKDLLMGEYNLVWHVLQKMEEYRNNRELASFVMSITGTLISIKEGERYRLKVIEPRADQKDFVAAYLKGGTTSVLDCNEREKCLAPRPSEISIQEDKAMKAKIIKKMTELRTKYISKENVTNDDINFLNDAVNLPVYRYIQVSVAAGTPFMMQDAAEYIAASVLLSQFDRVMSEVLEAVDALQKIQLEDTAIAEFKKNLQSARSRVQALLIGANDGSIYHLNQAMQAIEQAIIARNS